MVRILLACLAGLCGLNAAAGETVVSRTSVPVAVPATPAPLLELRDWQGQMQSIHPGDDSIYIIHFWATWCGSCREELPLLEQRALASADSSLRIITVATDSHAAVREYFHGKSTPLTVLIDQYGAAMRVYGVRALPTSFIVDGKGMVRFKAEGAVSWTSLDVKQLLRGL